MTDEQIETALNACMFGQTKADRCKDCPLDSDKEPCITNLHLAALEYIGRLKKRAEVAEKALKHAVNVYIAHTETSSKKKWWYKYFLREAEKELAEKGKDEQS